MPYMKKVIEAGLTIEVENYYTAHCKKPGMKREKKSKPTKEAQKKINRRNAEKKLRRIINANFVKGDFHLILTYMKEEREKAKEANVMRKNIDVFLRKLRKAYRAIGSELKYVHVMEIGKRGALHHHLVINNIDVNVLVKAWKHGRIQVNPLDGSGQYGKLASYLLKDSDHDEKKLQGKRWDSSKNLKIPQEKKRVVPVKYGYRLDVKPKKGYYIDKESIIQGIDEYTGYPYLHYTMIKLEVEYEQEERCG